MTGRQGHLRTPCPQAYCSLMSDDFDGDDFDNGEGDIPELSAELGIEEYHLSDLLHQAGLPNNGCTPYVAATGGMENSALAMSRA